MRLASWTAVALTALVVPAAQAQSAADFPTSTVRIFVPFAAGGPTDVVARILADQLAARWGGKIVVIENRPAPARSWRRRPWPKRRPMATAC